MAHSIYADANATYPVPSHHYDEVASLLKEADGNPSSIHSQGRRAKVALEQARERVAALVGCRPLEIIFTSGATESNNMVLHGLVTKARMDAALADSAVRRPHILVSAVEHPSVLEPARVLAGRGDVDLEILAVTSSGQVDRYELLAKLRPDTALVCIMYANNEVGSINGIEDLVRVVKDVAPAAHFHTDAVQLLGKSSLEWLGKSPVDSAAFSGHKIGAYKGVGALHLKSKSRLALFMAGGGQERGRRPGTENIPGILSFGLRCQEIRGQELATTTHMHEVRNVLVAGIAQIRGGMVHGASPETALPNTVHFHIDQVPGDDILLNFDLEGIQVSSGSACSSGSARPSHVVLALGYSEWVALNSIRVSFSRGNTADDARQILRVLEQVALRVRGYL